MENFKRKINKKKRRKKMANPYVERILKLYEIYGFQCIERTENYLVLTYSSGYFNNVEIVQLCEEFCCNSLTAGYEALGWAFRLQGELIDIQRNMNE